jgi:peptidoglycan/LPS O-acetylase OafA/YrhL
MLEAVGNRRYGGFDLIRVGAAAAVVVSHSYVIAGGEEPIVLSHSGDVVALGSLAVIVFFAASGYLVCQSWERDPRLVPFAIRRVFRIWPGLLTMLALTTASLAAFSSLDVSAYLRDPHTITYAAGNALIFPVQFTLPGVFEGSPTTAINGSLWTLELEVVAYMLVAMLGVAGLYARRWVLPVIATGTGLAFTVLRWDELGAGPWIAGFPVQHLVRLLCVFFIGALLARVKLDGRIALALIGLTVVAQLVPLAPVYLIAIPYATIYLGTRQLRFASWFRANVGDPSYGMYVWAFPIQQLLWLANPVSPLLLAIEATLLVFAIGYVSWHVFEHPASRLGALLVARSERGNAPAPAPLEMPATLPLTR